MSVETARTKTQASVMMLTTPWKNLNEGNKASIIELKTRCFEFTNNPKVTIWDEHDEQAEHLMLYMQSLGLIGYCRICRADTFLGEASFSRVCVKPELQGNGIGELIVKSAIERIKGEIQILVRPYLVEWYQRQGFEVVTLQAPYYLMQYKTYGN